MRRNWQMKWLKNRNGVRKMDTNVNSNKGGFGKGFLAGVVLSLLIVLVGFCFANPFANKKATAKTMDIVVKDNKDTEEEKEADNDHIVNAELLAKMQALESTIDKYFYLDRKTNDELRDGIYKGMMSALGDPYTEYYSKEELVEIENSISGIYYGIGAQVNLDTETQLPKISGVIENTPAEEAGLHVDDLIYKVDGKEIYGMSLTEAVTLIRGEEGTQVMLTIIRDGEKDVLEIPVTRRKVVNPTAKGKMLEDQIGYIQITEFDAVTSDQFETELNKLKGEGMEKLIIDLRGNPGGSLEAVLGVARQILPKGLVVYMEYKDGTRKDYECDGEHPLNMPLVVLVNGNSASASEVLSGAIQDHGVGTLVGTTTYGKGIVQQMIDFKDGTAVKITICGYCTPNGRDIHGVGIEPDVVCEFDSDAYYDEENPVDNQLEKAKEILKDE